jgi:hypothetical protein
MCTGFQHTKVPNEQGSYLPDGNRYAELVGGLMYLATHTRPDISLAVGSLARYMANPTTDHMKAVHKVLQYVSCTPHLGITFGGSPAATLELYGYSDSNHAGDLDTRRSTTGYVFMLYGGVVSWNSRLQPTVASSTTEAEYMAASSAVKEALWLRQLLPELGVSVGTVRIDMDNQGAIKILRHPNAMMRCKHIDIMHHFAKERVLRGEISIEYVGTDAMLADFLTKAVDFRKFEVCRSGLGVL